MKNADMPAMPANLEVADLGFLGISNVNDSIKFNSGLTKREIIAKDITISEYKFNSVNDVAEFIGRDVNQQSTEDLIKASAECEAKIRVIYADALLEELDKCD